MQTVPAGERPGKTEDAEAVVAEGRKDEAVEQVAIPTCGTCRAWIPIASQNAEVGRCHRRSPRVIHGPETDTFEGYTDTVWPETAPDEGCWDHLPMESLR